MMVRDYLIETFVSNDIYNNLDENKRMIKVINTVNVSSQNLIPN